MDASRGEGVADVLPDAPTVETGVEHLRRGSVEHPEHLPSDR
jgi:hypothetical protein